MLCVRRTGCTLVDRGVFRHTVRSNELPHVSSLVDFLRVVNGHVQGLQGWLGVLGVEQTGRRTARSRAPRRGDELGKALAPPG